MSKTTQRKQSYFSVGRKARIKANVMANNSFELTKMFKTTQRSIPKLYQGAFYAGWCSAHSLSISK